MNKFEYKISLRVWHPSLAPENICEELGLSAEYKCRAGENRRTASGQHLPGVYQETHCPFLLEHNEDACLAESIKKHNHRLLKHKRFFNKIVEEGGRIEYFIGWFSPRNSGEVFDWKILSDCGDLRINLALDVYGEATGSEE